MDLIEIPRVDNVKYYQLYSDEKRQRTNSFIDCSLCLTSHHLIFSAKEKSNKEVWIQHSLIDSLDSKVRETKFQIVLKCKDFKMFLVDFPSLYSSQSIARSLEALSNITSENMKFPFFYQLSFKPEKDGWDFYSIQEEFNKMFDDPKNCVWRISDVNKDYKVCNTYPQHVIVPKNVDDAMLIKSGQFRAWGRFPVLSYHHKPTKSFMMRCSQPLSGSGKKRSKDDETLLKAGLQIGKRGYIFDLREVNAMKSSASKGGGYETEANYPLWTRINRHCDKHDQLHSSLSKFIDACANDDKWLNKLESSNWFGNIRQVLHTAVSIADEMHNKNGCVIVHGNDGTDNTLVITSLVHILLNPETRTIKGFEMLLESEWLRAGHPFFKRCFKSAYGSTTHKSEGPIFLLFLECVRQLMAQFCLSFEFNEEFLIALFDNVYASEFGTFLGNCQLDRENLFLSSRTASFWSFVHYPENFNNFLNPLYEQNKAVLWPSLYYQSLTLWSSLYLRYQQDQKPFEEAKIEMLKIVEEDKEARLKINKLKSELLELQNEAAAKGIL